MLYADDAEVVSQSPEKLRKMMEVIVVMSAAFGLTVSKAKTEIMCLRTKRMPESTAIFSVEAAGQVYNQTNELVYFGGNANHNADLSIEVHRRIRNALCSFQKYTLGLYNRSSVSLELKICMLRVEVFETKLYGCVTWGPRACHYGMMRRAHHIFLTRCIGWRKKNHADHPIAFLEMLIKTRQQVGASRRLCAGSGSCSGICGAHGGHETAEVRDVQRTEGGAKIREWGVSWTTSEFRYQRRPVDDCSPRRGGMAQDGRTRGGTFRGEMDRCCRESKGWTTVCSSSSMPEHDGKDQGGDSPKQACSCRFARHS